MSYKRGAKIRTELKTIKENFYNELSRLEIEIVESDNQSPQSDYFNHRMCELAIMEVRAIKIFFERLNKKEINRLNAEMIITSSFTKREKNVFKLVIKGYKSQKIADILGISKKTVDCHLKNMLSKICADNMFLDVIKHSARYHEFENVKYKNDINDKNMNALERTELRSPQKLLKYLYDIVSN